MAWQQWNGWEVAQFVAKFCELPQYSAAMSQMAGHSLEQLSGPSLSCSADLFQVIYSIY